MALPVSSTTALLEYFSSNFWPYLLWFLGNTLLPFILGGAIAYCLDPVADRLQRFGLVELTCHNNHHTGRHASFCTCHFTNCAPTVEQAFALFNTAPTITAECGVF